MLSAIHVLGEMDMDMGMVLRLHPLLRRGRQKMEMVGVVVIMELLLPRHPRLGRGNQQMEMVEMVETLETLGMVVIIMLLLLLLLHHRLRHGARHLGREGLRLCGGRPMLRLSIGGLRRTLRRRRRRWFETDFNVSGSDWES